jgi:hypothetical protein
LPAVRCLTSRALTTGKTIDATPRSVTPVVCHLLLH